MTHQPARDGAPPDQVERAQARAAELRHRVADVAESIAGSEDKVAETFEASALLRPHAATRLRRSAEDARSFAAHEREQVDRLRAPAEDDPPRDDGRT